MEKYITKKQEENLLVMFKMDTVPTSSADGFVSIKAELFKHKDTNCSVEIEALMDVDDYLDLIIEKNNCFGKGGVYFTSNIIDDFYRLSKKLIKKETSLILTTGILSLINEKKKSYEILKQI